MSDHSEDVARPGHPLDAEELALARLLAQLPASAPSATTDQAILDRARRACEAPVSRGRGWPWGMGAGLAAVLALVMLWPEPILMPPMPLDGEPRREPLMETSRERSRPATLSIQEPTPSEQGALAPAAMAVPQAAVGEVDPLDAVEAGQEIPIEDSSRSIASPLRVEGEVPAPEPGLAAQALGDAAAVSGEHADVETAAAAERAARRDRAETETGADARTRLHSPTAIPAPEPIVEPFLPPPEADAELSAENWLRRIQQRLGAGQRDEAIRSLSLFRERHPDHPLPPELDALLR